MANNIFANIPALVFAKETASFSSLGINSTKVSVIREAPTVANGTFKSFFPITGYINAITGFTRGKAYILYPKIDMDLTEVLMTVLDIPSDLVETFLTYAGVSSDITQEVNGLVKATGSAAFGTVAASVETFGVGSKLAVDLDGQNSEPELADKIFGLFPSSVSPFTGFAETDFALYVKDGNIYSIDNNVNSYPTVRTTVTNDDHLAIWYKDAGTVEYQKSTDNGVTWTTFFTSPTVPTGTYKAGFDIQEVDAYFHNIRKIA